MLCVLPAGLQPPFGHITVIYQAAVLAPLRFPRSFIAHRLLSPCFLHLGYDWSLCLAQLTPAYGVTSMPIHPGCHRPFSRSVVRRSVADACRGLALCFLFDFCFLCSRSSPSIVVASACHHSVRLHSPALRPVFYQLARTGFLVEGSGFGPPAHPRLFREYILFIPSCRFAPSFPAFSFLVSWYLSFRLIVKSANFTAGRLLVL